LLGRACSQGQFFRSRELGEFGATLMLAGNIPGRTETIPIAIYFAVEAMRCLCATWCLITLNFADAVADLTGRTLQSPERVRWARR
jgi:molybdate transport system permease protein